MFAVAGSLSLAGNSMNWSRLFALQPEPDLEFTEEELEQTAPNRATPPSKSPKKSGGRPVLWVLILALVGGGIYVAMEPELITDLLAPLLGEEPLPAQTASKPMPSVVPSTVPGDQAAKGDTAAAPVPPPAPPAAIPAPIPAPTVVAPPPAQAPIVPAATASPTPMFGEGQKVTVALDPTATGDTVALSLDAAGTRPGPAVRPGMTLTILDGDLQPGGWVYAVRSDDGAKGWVPEHRLRLKP
jgi:hypothetical protein